MAEEHFTRVVREGRAPDDVPETRCRPATRFIFPRFSLGVRLVHERGSEARSLKGREGRGIESSPLSTSLARSSWVA